ncbi:MAG: leucine-rich repeat protein [Eubacteriales bacterium]|nr:leucine-rich repeat protein [Eubacteriales bacterium]
MKKKLIALMLAFSMVVGPVSSAVAAEPEFSDGSQVLQESEIFGDTEGFQDEEFQDAEFWDNMEENSRFGDANKLTLPQQPYEETIPVGDNVYATLKYEKTADPEDNSLMLSSAVISGTGPMWNYLEDGKTLDNAHANPFFGKTNNYLQTIIIENGVTSVSDYLLANAYEVRNITFGNSIKRIGKHAFENCFRVETLNLPDGVEELGESSFQECGRFTEVNMPDTITKLGNSCFQGCDSIKTIKLPSTLTNIPSNAFSNCLNLENIVIPESVVSIGSHAFSYCKSLVEIVLPPNLETIGYAAFMGCNNIKSIVVPKSVINIGTDTFWRCSRLESIVFNAGCSLDIPGNMFYQCINLKNVTLPEGITGISNSAFSQCIRLQEITIPKSVSDIDPTAFEGCDNLSKINGYSNTAADRYAHQNGITFESLGGEGPIPTQKIKVGDDVLAVIEGNTLTLKGSGATYDYWSEFDDWYNGDKSQITDIAFEGNITYIGNYFFNGFNGIKEVNFPNGLMQLGIAPLCQCKAIEKITFPSTLQEIPAIAYEWDWTTSLDNLKTVIIPEGVKAIGKYAFSNCHSLESCVIPEGVEVIGEYAFSNCRSLESCVIPEGVTQIGNNIFDNCTLLKDLTLPSTLDTIPELGMISNTGSDNTGLNLVNVNISDGVKYIGENAFYKCLSLKNIALPHSIIGIFDRAFYGSGLEKTALPDKLQHVGYAAFCECSALKAVQFSSATPLFDDMVFAYTGIETVNWPQSISVIPSGIFNSCYDLREVTIPEGVVKIDRAAFSYCTSLKEVSIPESMTDIGDENFWECSSLAKISIPKSVTYFGNDVFYNCRKLTVYGYTDSMAERYAHNNSVRFVSADYKVVFKNAGKTVTTQYVLKGENATPPTLTKDGYILSWDGDYTDIQEDMIINAIWTKINGGGTIPPYNPDSSPVKYTVTFMDRGKVVKTEKVASGEGADLPFIQRYGYDLAWDKEFAKVTSDITVNAVWTVIKPSKVTSLTAEVLPKYIRLSWDESEFTGYYLVYRKLAAEKDYTQVAKTTKILWNDKTVKVGTEYQYKVLAVRSVEGKKYEGVDSEIVKAKIGTPEIGKIYTSGNLNYKVANSKEVTVTSLAKAVAELTIPASVSIAGKSFKVTAIDHKAFYKNADIINVKISNNVTYVGQYSFYQCPNLETVKFGKNVQIISTCAFAQCPELGNIVLPGKVSRLGAKVFYHCPKLKSLTIKTLKLEYIGKKGLAIDRSTVIKVPSTKYAPYKKMITKSVKFAATKVVKL